MKLTAENVRKVGLDCMFKDGTDPNEAIKTAIVVEGIVRKFGYDPVGIERNRENIKSMLLELPETFHAGHGGGWSFLNACTTKDGVLWGQHVDMEHLMTLGIAAGYVSYGMPRDMWKVLPGSVPYFTVDTNPKKEEEKDERNNG